MEDLAQNAPNNSLMFMSFSPTFGNLAFQIDPVGPGGEDMQNNYPTIPYISLEAMIYQQMMSNPLTDPVGILGGSNTGQQVIAGQYTQSDQNGTSRVIQGYQTTNQ